jgi:hypothetical protein
MPRRNLFRRDSWEYGHDSAADEQPLTEPRKRRTATMFVYAALFFAGAAFTAVAGDKFAQMNSADNSMSASADSALADSTSTDTTTDGTTTTADLTPARAESALDSAPSPTRAAAPSDSSAPTGSRASSASPALAPTPATSAPSSAAPSSGGGSSSPASHSTPTKKDRTTHKKPSIVLLPATKPLAVPEIEGPASAATIWLNRPLGDPTPPALRLSPKFARQLKAVSKQTGVDWALMLGLLRAKGLNGHFPADKGTLLKLAARLSSLGKHTAGAGGNWATLLAYDGTALFADKAAALARYDHAVGLSSLVRGLEASKRALEDRILNDPMINIYPGGRDDIAKDKVDVRVLAAILYLKQSFGQVTVSCLISGHRLYARPGVISAHIYGRAVDISVLGNTPILGHQQPGGVTEQAVRDILLLPGEVMPKQVISLLGLGGPSFPLADHYNHIHIGW